MRRSKISWTNSTWEIVSGCSKVSAGCTNCFAERMFPRIHGREVVVKPLPEGRGEELRPRKFSDVLLHPERLDAPLSWRKSKPRRVFVCSRADLFHEAVPDEFLDRAFAVMAMAGAHTFQVLTKRPERMRAYCSWSDITRRSEPRDMPDRIGAVVREMGGDPMVAFWPLPNVQLGTSVENQEAADERIPHLLEAPAAVRFLSLEPLLGLVNLEPHLFAPLSEVIEEALGRRPEDDACIDWVIVGGESGPKARPMGIDWVRSIRDQCVAAMVPLFVKQDSGLCAGRQGNLPDDLWAMKEFPNV